MGNRSKSLTRLLALFAFATIGISSAQQPAQEQPPDDVRGNWMIDSKNIDNNEVVATSVQIDQDGNKLTGHFRGPNQSGGIAGTVNGHHIEFSTKTPDALTFRGQVNGNHISGLYGIHGRHAEWKATKVN